MGQARHLRLVGAETPLEVAVGPAESLGLAAASAASVASLALGAAQLLAAARLWTGPWSELAHATAGLALAPALVLTLSALHAGREGPSPWSTGALALGVLYAGLVCPVYVARLAVVIPAELVGDAAPGLLTPSALGALEAFGFAMGGLACALLGLGTMRAPTWARRLSLVAAVLAPTLPLLKPFPGLLPLALTWAALAPIGLFTLARRFARGE